jgi:glycosyltransferase involved in cell wall biosynthesis
VAGRPLRVFVLPSWYPHRSAPVLGIFSQEQVLAIGDLRPDWSLAVGLWGQGEYDFALSRPAEWPARLGGYLRAPSGRHELTGNVVEHRTRAATWARQLFGGNLRGVVRAARRAFDAAAAELGGIDLIHAHVSVPGGLVAVQLREQVGVPFVLTEHWHYPPTTFVRRDGSLDERVRIPMQSADAVLGVSTAQAADIAACGLPRPDVIPPSVDEREFVPLRGAGGERIVLSSICNMVEGKGIDDLLQALARLLPRLDEPDRERLELRLGGEGRALPRYQRLAEELGVSRWTRWLGVLSREQVRRELQECTCFVLPSRKESFGVVYAEAMACGKPVVAARAGGPEDIVTDATGVLVEPGDVDALADALAATIEAPDRFDPDAIRDHFMTRFSRPAVVAQLEQVYRRVTGL